MQNKPPMDFYLRAAISALRCDINHDNLTGHFGRSQFFPRKFKIPYTCDVRSNLIGQSRTRKQYRGRTNLIGQSRTQKNRKRYRDDESYSRFHTTIGSGTQAKSTLDLGHLSQPRTKIK